MSAFAEFLEQKGYFVSEIEDANGMHESYIFRVFLNQEDKESYTPSFPIDPKQGRFVRKYTS